MNVCVLILRPSGGDSDGLVREFQAEAGPDWAVQAVASPKELLRRLAQRTGHHLVVVPNELSGPWESGLELVAQIREATDDTPVVVTAERGDVDLAARAIAAGATDLLVRGENLGQRIRTLLGKLRGLFRVIDRNRRLDQANADLREAIQAPWKIVGKSPRTKLLLAQIERVAKVPRPVLIVGERGTGKELVARAIHLAAGQSSRPMITVNCAAFNDALLESELFGHEKGAFTGADTARCGRFEQADGGTLFLDEIGNMSLSFQEKILRVVEYGSFTRVGGTTELKTSARVIAATNRDLREEIRAGRFLADLYDRLAFETIAVPPLRERKGDIAVLAQFFLHQFAREIPAFAGKRLSHAALKALAAYPFPGNIRELKNLIERAAYRDVGNEISPEDLDLRPQDDLAHHGASFHESLDALAQRLIRDALQRSSGNGARAARELGLPYHQFRYYFKKYFNQAPLEWPHEPTPLDSGNRSGTGNLGPGGSAADADSLLD